MNQARREAIETCVKFMAFYKTIDSVHARIEYELLSKELKQIANEECLKCRNKNQNLESKNTH